MQTTIHIKTDKAIKKRAEQFASQNGITLTALINIALRQVLTEKRLVIGEPLVPNAKTGKLLLQRSADAKKGKNMSPAFTDPKKALDWLHS